ncbi:CitMHS family transporter [Nocardiopsis sp. NPDC050513]|uniref:CitMHS family transporter n=1 Tax=Nocardiopsis sp. NPDC050513 TaxID=3364338 RepID=UPI00378DEF72
MLTVIGAAVIVSVSALLISGRVAPVVALSIVPLLGAFAAGFTPGEIGAFFESGVGSVLDVAVMLIFAILFFGVMNDAGIFRPLVDAVVRLARGDAVAVAVGTVLLAAVCHLDGAGSTTYLICLPALLPVYQRMRMSPYLLMLLMGTSMGILNMLPWGGPVGRAGVVLGMDPVDLWRGLIPVQAYCLVLLIVMAVVLGLREKRRIRRLDEAVAPVGAGVGARGGAGSPSGAGSDAGAPTTVAGDPVREDGDAADTGGEPRPRVRRPLVNVALIVTVLAVLVWGILPSGYVFMVGLGVALVANYPRVSEQMDRIKAHAASALGTGAIILAAGTFLGTLEGTGMLDALAADLVGVLPAAVVPQLHLVVGVLGLPLELVLSTDAHYFGLLPLVESTVTAHGGDSLSVAYAVIVGNIIGTYISPFNASLWLGVGLAGVDLGRHIRYSLPWMWAFSLAALAGAVAMGVVSV